MDLREFPACLAALKDALAFVAEAGARAGLPPPLVLRAELAIEELFANSVVHGYGAAENGSIWIAADARAGALHLTYQDAAPGFDPLAAPPAPRPGRGYGVRLLAGLFPELRYARENGRNTVRLVLADSAAGA